MATKKIDLIRSGLPWASPLKIIVQSSQIINDVTINRGLLNLLNNDYYLDLKTEAINNYIEDNLVEHIADKSIHFTIDEVKKLIGTYNFLTKNTAIRIPIRYISTSSGSSTNLDINLINQFIDLIPKVLNGFTLIIQFISAKSKDGNISETSNIIDFNCAGNCILFNGFSNGTLIITSNYSKMIQIDSYSILQNIQDLSLFEQTDEEYNILYKEVISTLNKTQNKLSSAFNFMGNGVNSHYSVISVEDCTADVYITNLGVTNTLSEFTSQKISEAIYNNCQSNFPEKEDLLALFLCNQVDTSTKQIAAKEKYTNFSKNGFSTNPVFDVNVGSVLSAINDKWSDTDQTISTCVYLNPLEITDDNLFSSPDYFQFNNDDNSFEYDNLIRDYMYNQNTNFSICFFGKYQGINQHIPLISDYYVDDNNKATGIAVYADQIIYSDNSVSGGNTRYYTSNITDATLRTKTCLYVIDFITSSITDLSSNYISGCYAQSNRHGATWMMQPSAGNFIVNVHVITDNNWEICIPNMSISGHNQFRKPGSASKNYSMTFFGNKVIQNYTNFMSWHYFSGKIRNLFMFKKILTTQQIKQIYNQGIKNAYYWPDILQKQLIKNISISSYIGALSLYNSNKVNINNIEVKTSNTK